jgi:hypothetical protein
MEPRTDPAGEIPLVRMSALFKEGPEQAPIDKASGFLYATVVDLTEAIYDFNLAYEISVLRTLEQYADYNLSNFFLLGRNRPVSRDHQLIAERVSFESPLFFLGLIPHEVFWWTAGGAGTGSLLFLGRLVDIVEKVYTVPTNFKNARLRSQVENARLRLELDEVEEEAVKRLRKRVAPERFQLTEVEIDSDDFPSGLA